MEQQAVKRKDRSSAIAVKAFGGKVVDNSILSKEEFIEKVRQSNDACKNGDFQLAIELYSETLLVDPQNCILYSNRSAAYLKTTQYEKALDDAIKARLLNPKWPKDFSAHDPIVAHRRRHARD
ncbi:hypothetical protein GDO81_002104 [Engystomops pustulosus]|uniref:Uncharacterized protein n=1 Tax=Engystomops pustulosus TaxID=76066 RepID=A0AAV7DHE7_ENGPU|nr:hypothetical protein GDO81_002104 [Engystomops pustulosus]